MRVSLQREEVIGRRLRYRGHGSSCNHTREVKELVLHTGCGFQTQVFAVLMSQSIQKAKEATVLLGELYHHPFAPSPGTAKPTYYLVTDKLLAIPALGSLLIFHDLSCRSPFGSVI